MHSVHESRMRGRREGGLSSKRGPSTRAKVGLLHLTSSTLLDLRTDFTSASDSLQLDRIFLLHPHSAAVLKP